MTLRSLLLLLTAAGINAAALAFDTDEFRRQLDTRGAERIEGIWQFTDNGATIAISRTDHSSSPRSDRHRTYSVTLISSPIRTIRPGTSLGVITPTADPDQFEAQLFTYNNGSILSSPKNFSLSLDDPAGRITFRQHKSRYAINLWHFVPYLWRYSIRQNKKSASPSGCIRLYPSPAIPAEPRYL